MKTPVRYNFDSIFALDEPETPEEPTIDLITAENQAKAAYEEGFAAGRSAAIKDQTAQVAATLDRLVGALPALETAIAAQTNAAQGEATGVAYRTAKKLASSLIAKMPQTEIETMIAATLAELQTVPHVVIRVHETLAEMISTEAKKLATMHGFEGRLIVMGEPDIALGDGRIEWADGGIVREQAVIEQTLDEAVGRFVATHQAPLNGDEER